MIEFQSTVKVACVSVCFMTHISSVSGVLSVWAGMFRSGV